MPLYGVNLDDTNCYWSGQNEAFAVVSIALLDREHVRYCVIGGLAVNAYAEPVVSLDLDLAITADDLPTVESVLLREFRVERFPHRLNVSAQDSDIRVRIQTDPRYSAFVDRAAHRTVLGLEVPVAAPDDVLRGKIWAAQDETRRPSERQKGLRGHRAAARRLSSASNRSAPRDSRSTCLRPSRGLSCFVRRGRHQYSTPTRNRPWAGAVGPAAARSQDARIVLIMSGVQRPAPMSTSVPAIVRTM